MLSTFNIRFVSPIIGYFLTYCLGAILIRGISFFTLPLIMHRISPSEYGTFSLLTAFMTITTAIIGLGLRQFFSIEYFHADKDKRRLLIHDIITIYTTIALPITLLLWLMRSYIIRTLFFNTITTYQLLGILITTFLFFYSELMYQLLQYEQSARLLTSLQCFLACFIAGSTCITVFYFHGGITGMLWSQTSGTCIAAGIAYLYLRKYHISYHSLQTHYLPVQHYIYYGFPFIPGIIASWILSSANRWILGYYMTMHDVGIYAVADLASQLFYIVILQSWAASYLPYIMKRYQEHAPALCTIELENHRTMWITMIGLALIISCCYPIGYYGAAQLLPPIYLASLHYAWILLMGQLFLLGTYFTAALIQYTKRIFFLVFALCSSAVINIVLNFIFIPRWGIMGCSITTVIAYGSYFIGMYVYNKKILLSKETL